MASEAPRRTMDLALEFLAHLELERGSSSNTLEAYRSDLQQYAAFLVPRGLDPLTAAAAPRRRVRVRAGERGA